MLFSLCCSSQRTLFIAQYVFGGIRCLHSKLVMQCFIMHQVLLCKGSWCFLSININLTSACYILYYFFSSVYFMPIYSTSNCVFPECRKQNWPCKLCNMLQKWPSEEPCGIWRKLQYDKNSVIILISKTCKIRHFKQ